MLERSAEPGAELNALSTELPRLAGRHDLCFSFTANSLDPMPVTDRVQLMPTKAGE